MYTIRTLIVLSMTVGHAQSDPKLNIVSEVDRTEILERRPHGSNTCKQKTDIILAIDMSGSINDAGAVDLAKKSAVKMIQLLPIEKIGGKATYRVGVLMYSGEQDTKIIFHLKDLTSANLPKIAKLILDSKINHGQTHTDKALKRVREQMFTKARNDAKKVLVIVSDGEIFNTRNWKAHTNKERSEAEKLNQADLKVQIDELEAAGVLRIGFGIGSGAGGKLEQFRAQLMSMVSNPKKQHYFEVNDWNAFETYFPGLVSSKCTCPDISNVDILIYLERELGTQSNPSAPRDGFVSRGPVTLLA